MKNELLAGWAEKSKIKPRMLQLPAEGRLVSLSLPAPKILPHTFLKLAEGHERIFWQNGQDQTYFAGFGSAVQLMAWGTGRFQEIQEKIGALFGEAVHLAKQPELASPRFFGGFAFRDDFTPDKTWAVFHPAHFILPHYLLVGSADEHWLTINALVPDGDDVNDIGIQLREALQARIDLLVQANSKFMSTEQPPAQARVSYPLTFEQWAVGIENAIAQINATNLEKAVLSRVCELRADERIDVCQALAYLNRNFRECTRFLFEPRPYHAFYGATPELLIETNGAHLKTMALAGSMQRGATVSDDLAHMQQLLHSNKDRHEHALVVHSIRRRLEPFAAQLTIPPEPEIYSLSYIHHLLTPIEGRLQKEIGVLPLVEALHPTPALGGSPRDLALAFIRDAEPVPRGWYAAPIGWVDANMDGQFAVGIRSAVAQERRVWLYAGAGIVADSEPRKEWEETSLKFRPMLAALGLQNEPISDGLIKQ